MKIGRAREWKRTAQTLSRSGLLWLALTALALSSFLSAGASSMMSARLVAASNLGAPGKLKPSGPAAPSIVPGEVNRSLPHRAHGPDAGPERILGGGISIELVPASTASLDLFATPDATHLSSDRGPVILARAFEARGPPV